MALWPERWPVIAKQECIDEVNAAPQEEKSQVKWRLPCQDCEKNTACLVAKRKELGPLLFDREIQTRPRTSESSLFPRELFEPLLIRDGALVPYYEKPFGLEHRYAVVSAWDIAWSERTGGDWMVKFTGLLDRQTGVRRVIDIWRGQGLSFSQQMELIQTEWAKYRDDVVVIEADAAQKIWSQYLGETTAVPVLPHYASDKKDLAAGVPSLIMQLEAKKWEFPYQRGSFHHENVEVFLGEAESFGWMDGKLEGVGEHDDTVMAWWHLSYGLDMMANRQKQTIRKKNQPGSYI